MRTKKMFYRGVLILFVIFLIFFCYSDYIQAETENKITFMPGDSKGRYNINPYVELLEDPTKELSFYEVTSPEYSNKFELHDDPRAPSFSYTDSAIWVRFHLEDSRQNNKWLLELSYPLLNKIDFYYPDESGGYSHRKAGKSLPFVHRNVEHRNFVFNMPSEWDEEQPFYLRVDTPTAMVIPLTLWEEEHFISSTENNYLGLGIYYGFLLVIIFYTLILFVFTRVRDYLYYVIFAVSMGLFLFTYNGLSFQYLWPNIPWWGQNAVNFFLLMASASGLLFINKMLPVKKYYLILDKLLKMLSALAASIIPLMLVLEFSQVMRLGIFIVLASSLVILPTTIIYWQKKYRPAAYLFWGWMIFIPGVVLMSFRSLSFMKDTFFTKYGAQMGFGILAVFFLLGLADHMYILRKNKEKIEEENRRLELEKQRLADAETLNAMLQDIAVTDEISAISRKLLVYINKIIPFSYACFLQYNKEDNNFTVLACNNSASIDIADNMTGKRFSEDIFISVLESGEPHIIEDVEKSKIFDELSLLERTQSVIIIPIKSEEKYFGVVILESGEKIAYNKTVTNLAMNFAGQASLAIENSQLFQEINMLAITDGLTRLYNMRYFYRRGDEEFLKAKRYNLFLSLIIFDIDDFKIINDTYGHTAGDEVLKTIAQRCMNNIRKIDIACRYGGEEFGFILPNTNLNNAKTIGERLRKEITSEPVIINGGASVNITASFGISTFKTDMTHFQQMVNEADKALYQAKECGKNIVITSN